MRVLRIINYKKEEEDLKLIKDVIEISTKSLFTKRGKLTEPISSIIKNFIEDLSPDDKIVVEVLDKP